MTCLTIEAHRALEPINGDRAPQFKSDFFRARHPLERVEFDEWCEALAETLPLAF